MDLSASEFFILGRIMVAWRKGSAMPDRPHWARSLMQTVDHVFYEFGLEYVAPPSRWADVEQGDAPRDTAWKRTEGHNPARKPLGRIDAVIPGVPSLTMGVSPSAPAKLFVERTDGEVCTWVIGRPRSGLYLVIMRWLQPWAAVSPQVWLAMHEGTWPAVVEEWRTLPEFGRILPHLVFEDDRADGVFEAAEQAARGAGCEQAFRLGGLSAEVETALGGCAERAHQADAFRRHRNDYLGDPEENLRSVLASAEAAVRGGAVEQVCRADDGAIGFYESARREIAVADGPLGGVAAISRAIDRAHSRVFHASTYLYGTFRARGVA
jgi:hypothetical protein